MSEPLIAQTLRSRAAEPAPKWTCRVESFAKTCREALPLFKLHGTEVGLDQQPWKFVPKFELISKTCDADPRGPHGVWITIRNDSGTLIGYALFFVHPALVFKDTTQAFCEWIYVRPLDRLKLGKDNPALALLRFSEEEMLPRGAHLLVAHCWQDSGFWKLLDHMGYQQKQTAWWKILSTGE